MSSPTATTTKRACARCGREWPADTMVYSHFTRNRYCAPRHDQEKCARLAKRAQAEPEAAETVRNAVELEDCPTCGQRRLVSRDDSSMTMDCDLCRGGEAA